MARPSDEQVRAGGGWGAVGLCAAACVVYGMHVGDDRLVLGGVAGIVLVGILGAHGGA